MQSWKYLRRESSGNGSKELNLKLVFLPILEKIMWERMSTQVLRNIGIINLVCFVIAGLESAIWTTGIADLCLKEQPAENMVSPQCGTAEIIYLLHPEFRLEWKKRAL